MYPSHGLVKTDRTAGFGSWYLGRADCIVSGNGIQISRHPTESRMQIAGGCARVLAPGVEGSGKGGNQRNSRDQTHPLMDLEHVRPFIKRSKERRVGKECSSR